MNLDLGAYSLRARLAPALLVAMPLVFGVLAWFPKEVVGLQFIGGTLASFGMAVLLSHITRDRGKRIETDLFRRWGGTPTTQLLRHSGPCSAITRARYHHALSGTVPGIRIPSLEEEQRDPGGADEVYESCVNYLRERTRDQRVFSALFEENVSYGFRRNLLGMKSWGIATSVIGVLSIGVLDARQSMRGEILSVLPQVYGGIILVLLALWLGVVNREWVKKAAEAYAQRLVATCESLTLGPGS